MLGIVRHAEVNPATGEIGAFSTVHRGEIGDARGSSANKETARRTGRKEGLKKSPSAVRRDDSTVCEICPEGMVLRIPKRNASAPP
jgi:hypothetical protein